MRRICLVGAFDRFNYGDLLFPRLARQLFESAGIEARYEHYASRGADLRFRGGVRCEPLARLLEQGLEPGTLVVVAGGEVLSAGWADTLGSLTTPWKSLGLKVAGRLGGRGRAERLARRALGARQALPWVLGEEDLGPGSRVAYSAVGGCELDRLPASRQETSRRRLAQATYLSVRDPRTLEILRRWGLDRVELVPDSAALMAEVWSAARLRAEESEARTLRERYPEGYVVFQIGRYLATGKLKGLAEELRRLQDESGLALVLLPLGQAAGHEDSRPLAALHRALQGRPVSLAAARTVSDIAATLAGARLFVGSSLHGNLTALAYGVPRVGLAGRGGKLAAHVEAWDGAQPGGVAAATDFHVTALERLRQPPEIRAEVAAGVAAKASAGGRRLVAALLGEGLTNGSPPVPR